LLDTLPITSLDIRNYLDID